jgi:peptidoglycan/xylan/chitin deacetylase (PgdA/CDA1 family)
MKSEVAVLLYHHVGPVRVESCRGLTVTPESFSRQMKALAALGYSTVTPSQLADSIKGGAELPPQSFLITFDDGYRDLVEFALPELQRRSFCPTVFIPTSLIGGTLGCSSRDPSGVMPIMSREEIVEWHRRGVVFGAHSRSHPDLTTLNDDELADEVRGSRDDLSSIIGEKVDAFAYPYGKTTDKVRAVVSEVYDSAFTVEEGLNAKGTDAHLLRRTMVQHNDSIVDVCLRVRFGKSAMQSLRKGLRGSLDAVTR